MSPVTLDYPVTIANGYTSHVTPMLHVTRDRLTCDGGAH